LLPKPKDRYGKPNNGRFYNAIVRPPGTATAAATERGMEQAVKQLVFKPWNQKVQKREKTQGANVPLVCCNV
jgi:hypothetical protein